MLYFKEFRLHWPTLLGACIGIALGSALNQYLLSLFAPALLAEFGWQKSHFALIGTLSFISVMALPFAGRIVDRFGARKTALVGFIAVPLSFLAYSFMSGEIWQFFAITMFKNLFGVFTGTIVFCRVVVERFDMARGVALSIVMSGAPLVGAIGVPLIGEVIDTQGWRTGYRVLAAMSLIGGFVAILLIGRLAGGKRKVEVVEPAAVQPAAGREDAERAWPLFLALCRQPAFLLGVGGMFLVNFPTVIVASQMKLVLTENGATSSLANWLISLYGASIVAGRLLSGLALDRIPLHIVAVITLGLPTWGFIGLASGLEGTFLLATSVVLIGLAQGAEGDIAAFLTSRKFKLAHYSFVFSFLIGAVGVASAVGSLVLSFTLHQTGTFTLFLWLAALMTVAGTFAFFLTGRIPTPPQPRPLA